MSEPIAINGILNIRYFEEKAKEMTPEKMEAIKKRNEALSFVPASERKNWAKNNPLENFM